MVSNVILCLRTPTGAAWRIGQPATWRFLAAGYTIYHGGDGKPGSLRNIEVSVHIGRVTLRLSMPWTRKR